MTHKIKSRRFQRALLLSFLLIASIFTTLQFPSVKALSFSGPQQVPMGPSFSLDNKVKFIDDAPPNGTVLNSDPHLRYVDQNSNSHWDAGEPVVYDSNNDGVYESIEPIIAGTVSTGAALRSDSLVKFVDTNGDGIWDQGEPVVYDVNNSNAYNSGEPVIAGTPVVVGTSLNIDSHVKFVGAGASWISGNPVVYDSIGQGFFNATVDPHLTFVDTNANGHWDSGESVIQDVNLTRLYASGDRVLYGSTPTVGTVLKFDSKIKFVDTSRSGVWISGEAIVYDGNGNSVYDQGEAVILAANPPPFAVLNTDTKVKYVDTNGTGVWQSGKPVIYDSIGQGYFNATVDPRIKFWDVNGTGAPYHLGDSVILDKFGTSIFQTGDIVIAGPTPSTDGSAILTIDHHFHFVDSNLSGRWSAGMTLVYDSNLDHVFVTGEPVIVGTAPANGTLLTELVISGNRPVVGTVLRTDAKTKYLETDGNIVWNPGEAVVYDTNSNNVYDSGESIIVGSLPTSGTALSEPLIAGATPVIGSPLKTDPKLKFIDIARTGVWTIGDTVVYDSNGNGRYDQGEPVISAGAPGDGRWHNGEVVTYDPNNNSVYYTGDAVIFGTAPLNGTAVRTDPLIKYVDSNLNGHWDPGEPVAYDVNNDNAYDAGDLAIAGSAPPPSLFLSPATAQDYLGRTWLTWNEKPVGTALNPVIYFKIWNGTAWSTRQAVTNGLSNDNQNFVLPLINQTMMILWSSNRTGHAQIFYRLYAVGSGNPYPTIGPVQLTTNAMLDKLPSAVQDRNGRIWVTWTRQNSQSTISQIFYKYFNGTTWSADFGLPPASLVNLSQRSPYVTQTKDGKIRFVWASNDTSNLNLYYTTTNGTVTTLPTTGLPSGSWTAKTSLPFASSGNDDDHPSFVQSRDGVYWIFFQRSILNPPAEYIYYASSLDGVTWPSSATQLSTVEDSSPTAIQSSDQKIWVFWNSLVSSNLDVVFTNSTPISNIADLGVRAIAAPTLARSTYPLNITTVVTNFGDFAESAQLTLRANSTILNTWSINLATGQTSSLFYNWTNPQPWGRYTVTATLTGISPVENAINQGDDSLAIGPLKLSPPGDVNLDGQVNILDLASIAFCFGQTVQPSGPCNQYADPNHDGKIDILDLALTAFYFNKSV